MSVQAVLVLAVLAIAPLVMLGAICADRFNARYWKQNDWCPTCQRFGDDHPLSRLERAIKKGLK